MNWDPEPKKWPDLPDIDDLIFDEEVYESER
jgi:hypothetical protein